MQHCEFCGSELPSNARFCGLCGRALGSMRERQTDISDSLAEKLPPLNMPTALSQSAVSSAPPSIELPKSPGEPPISSTESSTQPKPTGSPQPPTQHHQYERPRRTPQSILLEVLGLEELKKIILKPLSYFVKKPETIVWRVIISLIILIGVLTTIVQDWTVVKQVAPKALTLLFSFAYHIGLAMLLIYLPSFAITSTNINLLWKSLKKGRAFIISMIVYVFMATIVGQVLFTSTESDSNKMIITLIGMLLLFLFIYISLAPKWRKKSVQEKGVDNTSTNSGSIP